MKNIVEYNNRILNIIKNNKQRQLTDNKIILKSNYSIMYSLIVYYYKQNIRKCVKVDYHTDI